jgi:hypothetical protein
VKSVMAYDTSREELRGGFSYSIACLGDWCGLLSSSICVYTGDYMLLKKSRVIEPIKTIIPQIPAWITADIAFLNYRQQINQFKQPRWILACSIFCLAFVYLCKNCPRPSLINSSPPIGFSHDTHLGPEKLTGPRLTGYHS